MSYKIYPYVEDEIFLREVHRVLNVVENSIKEIENDLYSNVIDPFSALFDAITQNISG